MAKHSRKDIELIIVRFNTLVENYVRPQYNKLTGIKRASDERVAAIAGVSQGKFSMMKDARKGLALTKDYDTTYFKYKEVIEVLCEYAGIDPHYFVTGEGEPCKAESKQKKQRGLDFHEVDKINSVASGQSEQEDVFKSLDLDIVDNNGKSMDFVVEDYTIDDFDVLETDMTGVVEEDAPVIDDMEDEEDEVSAPEFAEDDFDNLETEVCGDDEDDEVVAPVFEEEDAGDDGAVNSSNESAAKAEEPVPGCLSPEEIEEERNAAQPTDDVSAEDMLAESMEKAIANIPKGDAEIVTAHDKWALAAADFNLEVKDSKPVSYIDDEDRTHSFIPKGFKGEKNYVQKIFLPQYEGGRLVETITYTDDKTIYKMAVSIAYTAIVDVEADSELEAVTKLTEAARFHVKYPSYPGYKFERGNVIVKKVRVDVKK